MKVEIKKVGSLNGVTVRDVDRFEVLAPAGDYIIQAEIDEGGSPIQMLLSKGPPLAVKQLRLTRSSTYRVKKHDRNWPKKPSTVSEHDRKKPVRLKAYPPRTEAQKQIIGQALQSYWATMTKAERAAEMVRRMGMRKHA